MYIVKVLLKHNLSYENINKKVYLDPQKNTSTLLDFTGKQLKQITMHSGTEDPLNITDIRYQNITHCPTVQYFISHSI